MLSKPSNAELPNLSYLKDYHNRDWPCDDSLTDPLERWAANLLCTVIWGHHNEALNGPTGEAAPMLAEQYREWFPDRVFAVAQKNATLAAYSRQIGPARWG
jgi:hypothetical protein